MSTLIIHPFAHAHAPTYAHMLSCTHKYSLTSSRAKRHWRYYETQHPRAGANTVVQILKVFKFSLHHAHRATILGSSGAKLRQERKRRKKKQGLGEMSIR